MVDLIRFLMGERDTVYNRQANLFHRQVADYTVEDVSATMFGFSEGDWGVLYATNGAIPGRWINNYRLVAQNLTAEFADANHATLFYTSQPLSPSEVVTSDRDLHLAEMVDLVTAIRQRGETRTPLREGARSLDLPLAARRSAETGREIALSSSRRQKRQRSRRWREETKAGRPGSRHTPLNDGDMARRTRRCRKGPALDCGPVSSIGRIL
jgi:predicted dehydrogenase